jgi:DNA primase
VIDKGAIIVDNKLINSVLSQVNIVDVVSSYLNLSQKGRNY